MNHPCNPLRQAGRLVMQSCENRELLEESADMFDKLRFAIHHLLAQVKDAENTPYTELLDEAFGLEFRIRQRL